MAGVEIHHLADHFVGLPAVAREPDAVTWIDINTLATADEGDLFGGSRGYTIFDRTGAVLHTSGNELELATARLGHYPEDRSENKGNEPLLDGYTAAEKAATGDTKREMLL